MKRPLVVAGNWKMNANFIDGLRLANSIFVQFSQLKENIQVILAPPAIHLHTIANIVESNPLMKVAAQNCHTHSHGAFTGEISAKMVKSTGASHVIIGHSERRKYAGESHQTLAQKVDAALASDLIPIFCCGEPLEIREANTQNDYVATQLKESLFHLPQSSFQKLIIAYEPVWAIGTGVTAEPQQAQDMHQHIRTIIADKYDSNTAESTVILYGGSCKPSNAEGLFQQPDVDGALVGGASLDSDKFIEIIKMRAYTTA